MEDVAMGFTRNASKQASGKNTLLARVSLVTIFFIFLSGALAVPFSFETMTLWYKAGADKTLLRAGQLAGMAALVMVMLQIILATPGLFLEKLFKRATLARCHRINGLVILLLAAAHVTLVLLPEGLANLPIGKKYWPEMVGFFVLTAIFSTVISTYLRKPLQTGFERWRLTHRLLGYGVLVLLPIHVVFVSESFEQGPLRSLLVFLFGALLLRVILVKTLSRFNK